MNVTDSSGTLHYDWIEDWAKTPDTESSRENGRTHAVAEASDGHVYVFYQATPAVLVFDRQGQLARSFGSDFPAAHGLTLVQENSAEYLWLADCGGRVAKLSLLGETVQTLEAPSHPAYPEKGYIPTWVSVDPDSGSVWVADGYGESLVHRYDASGRYLSTIDGTEEGAAGRFACPHAIWFDTRSGKDPELYVADRSNKRVQVYDGRGRFKRAFGEDFFVHPSAFASYGDLLYVPELFARLAVLDGKDRLIGYVGEDKEIVGDGSWPASRLPEYPNFPHERLVPGKFDAPHGVGVGSDGSVYVVEWYFPQGRITKLVPK